MALSVLALSLVGLSAVHAVPASKTVEERQGGVWGIGSGAGSIWGGSGAPVPTCIDNVPLAQQAPCFPTGPLVGGFRPPKDRRQGSFGAGPSSQAQAAVAALEKQ